MNTLTRLPGRRILLKAVSERDATWDGLFIVAVRTTRIACRPTCPSRPARPENLEFFPSLDEARSAGFRPCLRCHPERLASEPEWWRTLLSLVDQTPASRPTDAQLVQHGLDPVRVRRHCRRAYGATFHAWLRARRLAAAQRRLNGGAPLDDVIVNSSWDSHSGFRDAFSRLMGAPPGRARDAEPVVAATWDSPLGPIVAAAVDEGLVLLEFGEMERLASQAPVLRRWFPGPVVVDEHPHLTRLRIELTEYFEQRRREFTVPLAIRGTTFEQSVWQELGRIPYGATCSYADVAQAIDNPKAVRAVGSANGRNRLAIIIPCHRVVNADGRLGGYGGGLWRKVRLLELEGARLAL